MLVGHCKNKCIGVHSLQPRAEGMVWDAAYIQGRLWRSFPNDCDAKVGLCKHLCIVSTVTNCHRSAAPKFALEPHLTIRVVIKKHKGAQAARCAYHFKLLPRIKSVKDCRGRLSLKCHKVSLQIDVTLQVV